MDIDREINYFSKQTPFTHHTIPFQESIQIPSTPNTPNTSFFPKELLLSNRTIAERIFKLALRRVFYPAIPHIVAPQIRLSAVARHLVSSSTQNSAPSTSTTQSRSFNNSTAVSGIYENQSKMSNQPAHPTLLIPGPIEFDDAVLQSMSHHRYVFTLSPSEKLENRLLTYPPTVRVMSAPPS